MLLLEPSLGPAIRTFWDHTIRFQGTRGSPFSLWDWRQYHARGLPNLHAVQVVLEVAVAVFAVVVAVLPRRERTPFELAALTAALLIGVQLVLTHWFYLYLPWALPFVLLALFLPAVRPRRSRRRRPSRSRMQKPPERARLGLLVVAALVFVSLCAGLPSVWQGRAAISDLPVYERYGDAIEHGNVPYRDFRLEYPPGALAVFAIPSLVTGSSRSYARVFAVEMVLLGLLALAACLGALRALGAGGSRLAAGIAPLCFAPVLLGPLLLTRFDLYPAALTAVAVALLLAGRERLGSGALGAAIAVKLYPVVILPLAVAWTWRRRGRREGLIVLGVCCGVVALVFLPFVALVARWRRVEPPAAARPAAADREPRGVAS